MSAHLCPSNPCPICQNGHYRVPTINPIYYSGTSECQETMYNLTFPQTVVHTPLHLCFVCNKVIEGDECDHNCLGPEPTDTRQKKAEDYFGFDGGYVQILPLVEGGEVNSALWIAKEEIHACEDRRAMRRLVSEKLQPLGDALLAAMERIVEDTARQRSAFGEFPPGPADVKSADLRERVMERLVVEKDA